MTDALLAALSQNTFSMVKSPWAQSSCLAHLADSAARVLSTPGPRSIPFGISYHSGSILRGATLPLRM